MKNVQKDDEKHEEDLTVDYNEQNINLIVV